MTDKSFLTGNIPFVSGGGGDFGAGGAGSSWGLPQINTGGATGSWDPAAFGADAAAKAKAQAQSSSDKLKVPMQQSAVGAGAGRGFINPPLVDANAYPHTDNGSSEEFKLDFQPNILDNYDSVTYHFKLFMTSTEVSRSGDILNPDNQTIIAESGVSDLTIDKVEMNAVAVPSVESGTGTQTTMKFEIVEPSGAGLLDKMFYQSVALGIGNWLVMPCYLQLSFKGRDPDTSNSGSDGQPGEISSLVWVWPIKLTNAKANVTTVGTRYEFDAIVYNELAQGNSYFAVQHNIVLTGVDTFQSAMTDLENKLNQDQFLKLMDNYSIPDSYRIIVDPKIAGYKIKPNDDNKNSYRSGDFKILKDKTATFNSGTGVDKIIDSLLANTEEYQRLMPGATQGAGSAPGTINQNIDQMKKFWRVTTETRPIAFDKRRQDNAVEIAIFVFEYELGVNPASPTTTGGTPDSEEASRRRLKEYINKKILKKKYNYMFTGLNDQVITFDLNMNFSFAAAIARFGGAYYDSASKDIGPVIQHRAEEELEVTSQVRKIITMQNDATAGGKTVSQKDIDDAKKSVANSTLDQTTKDRYTTLLEQSKPENRLQYVNQARITGGIQANGAVLPTERFSDARYEAARTNATGLATPAPNSNLKFISDININSAAAKQAYQDFLTTSKGKLRPIPFREAPQEGAVGAGVESNSTSGKNKLASLFSTALYSTLDASLLHIKLTVKGDPYWLFPQPIAGDSKYIFMMDLKDTNEIMYKIKEIHKSTQSVNLFGTDNFLIVRFRTPRIYNETTNPDNPDPYTEVEAFSGVYRVLTIISKFEMGKFSQELTCLLDPVINTADFIAQVEANAQTLDKPTTTSDLIATGAKVVPPTTIKTQKIMGGLEDKLNGVVNTARNTAGQVKELGANTAGQVGALIKSNIPPLPNNDLVA